MRLTERTDLDKMAEEWFPVSVEGKGMGMLCCGYGLELGLCEDPRYVWRPYDGVNKIRDGHGNLRTFSWDGKEKIMDAANRGMRPFEVLIEEEHARLRVQFPKVAKMLDLPVQEWDLYIAAHKLQYVYKSQGGVATRVE
ncbi:MAG: hypothetical protein ABIG95_01535 [Candidatus Woesearchaeota archaeon]